MRRSFAHCLFAVTLALSGCAQVAPRPQQDATPAHAAGTAQPAWEWQDVETLQRAMQGGDLTSEALVMHLLARITALDDAGPQLNAVLEINPGALAHARRLDRERAQGRLRGPLHGIPVLLKDNIDVSGMVTSAGSLALAGHRPGRDATLVANLRDAGAVILGKTNLSEWANFRSTRSTSGWSAHGGQTRNPYVLDRNPCGSSSGSAVAVAAGFAPLAIGTETDGSIVCPAAVNGVVGMKPSLGLVSRHGIVPIADSQDTAGPIARSVADARLLLAEITGVDPADPVTADAPPLQPAAAGVALDGVRLGVLAPDEGLHPRQRILFQAALQRLRDAGAVLVADLALQDADAMGEAELQVLLHEFKHGLNRYLLETGAPVRSLEALIAFNRAHAQDEMRWFGQELFEQAQQAGPLDSASYVAARQRARRLAGPEGIDALLAQHRLDALLAPTTGPAWRIDPVHGDHYPGGSSSAAAVAGYPNVTVPGGQVHGLPVGISFFGPRFSDAKVLAIAAAFEEISGGFVPPRLLPTVETSAAR